MTLKERISRVRTGRHCLKCQSTQVSHQGTNVLSQHAQASTEVEHRFRCRMCFFRWSEFV
ncbi:MAG: hypothetical protein CVV27_12895 [Candidatus Melainabacteria bacterium HGW-Melainabacteria-1]|nr:MAG: hypothetical protein CVV27_12895 [Candidatus Melainabacteria bacterium HGW-Melainabacteria-1]